MQMCQQELHGVIPAKTGIRDVINLDREIG
jgi:hypothetical protein